jgi:hypothetical protein
LTEPPPKEVPPDLHDDLMGAALKHADDVSAPSPEATAAVLGTSRAESELEARIREAAPETREDAMRAADEALDDFGRRDGMAALRERMQAARDAQAEMTRAWQASPSREERAATDILNKIPMVDRNGNVAFLSETTVRSLGDAEQVAIDVLKDCK